MHVLEEKEQPKNPNPKFPPQILREDLVTQVTMDLQTTLFNLIIPQRTTKISNA
jgi:hypothetical protein